MKKRLFSTAIALIMVLSSLSLWIPTSAASGKFENADMTVLVPCENKSEASWVTNGADTTLINESLSPDGKNFKVNIGTGGEVMFATTPPSAVTNIEGIVFWVKTPDIDNYFTLQADNGGRHYQFLGTEASPATYYTIDKNGVYTARSTNWKNISLKNFEGFVVIPKEGFVYNWGGTSAPFNPQELSAIGFYMEGYTGQFMSVDDFGFYTDLNAFKASHVGRNFGGRFENTDMSVLVPCENKSEAVWVTNGVDATLTNESASPDGKNFKVSIDKGGEAMFSTVPPTGVSNIAGLVFWAKTPNVSGFYFVLQADNGSRHYMFSGTTSKLATYYTIDKSGTLQQRSADWKNLSLVNFEGFIIIPVESMAYNWGGTQSAFNPQELSGIGVYTDPYAGQSMSVDDFGYYTDLEAFKASHVGKSFSGKAELLVKIDEAKACIDKGSLYYSAGWDALVTAYDTAVEERDNPASTAENIASAVSGLTNAINGLQVSVDRTALTAALEAAKPKYDKGAIAYSSGWTEFKTAYESANATYLNVNATQEQIDTAINGLTTTSAALVDKYANRIELEKLLAEDGAAKTAYDLGKDEYINGWDAFKTAYDAAVALAANASATNQQIDTALTALEAAMEDLKPVQYNAPSEENKEMVVVNDGSNTDLIAYNNGRVVIKSSTESPDKKAYEIAVKPASESTSVVDISFNVMYPYDFDISTAQGIAFWLKTPAGATSPWINFDAHCDTMHFKLHELEFYTIDKAGVIMERKGPAILATDFEGWVIIPKSSIKFNWGSGGSQTFDLANVTSVGFNTAPDEEGGSAGKSFVVDDFSVYTDFDKLKTALGVKSDSKPTTPPTDNEKPDNTKQEANDGWIIDSDTAEFDSGYGVVANLKDGDSVTVKDVDFGDRTATGVSVKLNVVTPGKINVYTSSEGKKVLIATLNMTEATFEATEFNAKLSKKLTGKTDIVFEFAGGFEGEMANFSFQFGSAGSPDTSDSGAGVLPVLLAVSALAFVVIAKSKSTIKERYTNFH